MDAAGGVVPHLIHVGDDHAGGASVQETTPGAGPAPNN
jgi:hypothetical protein